MKAIAAQRLVERTFQTAEAEQRIQAAQSPAVQLARLHVAYGRARSEGRLDAATAIKAEAAALTAVAPVEYSVFVAALAAQQAA